MLLANRTLDVQENATIKLQLNLKAILLNQMQQNTAISEGN